MGQVFSNLIGTCNCSDNSEDENFKLGNDFNTMKTECVLIKERLNKLETITDTKHNNMNQRIENLELRIANKLNIMNEKFARLEDKIDTKFDLLILTINQNALRAQSFNKIIILI